MPGTLGALASGEASEWQATLIGRETVLLSAGDRQRVDAALSPLLGPLGDRGVMQETRRLVDRGIRAPWRVGCAGPRPTGESRCGRHPGLPGARWPA